MDPNENTEAEIYANIRDKALEEAAARVQPAETPAPETQWERGYWAGLNTSATLIRAIKGNATPQEPGLTKATAGASTEPAESASTKETT